MSTDPTYADITNAWIATQLDSIARFSAVPVTDHAPSTLEDIVIFAEFCVWLRKPHNTPDPAWDLSFLDDYHLFTRLANMLRHMQSTLPPPEHATHAWDIVEGDVEQALEWVEGADPLRHVTDVDAFLALVAQVKARTATVSQLETQVQRIDFRPFSEGLGLAKYLILPKQHADNDVDAFIALCLFRRHFGDWWTYMHPTANRDDFIPNLWLYPDHVGYKSEPVTSEKILREQMIIDAMVQKLTDYPDAEISKRSPISYGVFVDGVRIFDHFSRRDLGLLDILHGRAIELVWNEVKLFYETPNAYVYFGWGTSA